MVPDIHTGADIGGLVTYVSNQFGTEETGRTRVAHVEGLNLGTSNPTLAAQLMQGVLDDADALKVASGVSARGRKLQKPTFHISLSWHKDELSLADWTTNRNATLAEIRRAAHGALKALDIEERYGLLVVHTNTDHLHAHMAGIRVSEVDGRAATMDRSKKRLSEWAEEYETARGQIVTPGRAQRRAEREAPAPEPAGATPREGEQTRSREKRSRSPHYGAQTPVECQMWREQYAREKYERPGPQERRRQRREVHVQIARRQWPRTLLQAITAGLPAWLRRTLHLKPPTKGREAKAPRRCRPTGPRRLHQRWSAPVVPARITARTGHRPVELNATQATRRLEILADQRRAVAEVEARQRDLAHREEARREQERLDELQRARGQVAAMQQQRRTAHPRPRPRSTPPRDQVERVEEIDVAEIARQARQRRRAERPSRLYADLAKAGAEVDAEGTRPAKPAAPAPRRPAPAPAAPRSARTPPAAPPMSSTSSAPTRSDPPARHSGPRPAKPLPGGPDPSPPRNAPSHSRGAGERADREQQDGIGR